MKQIAEGDYIEHWESGVGKVIKINETSVTVDFLKRGNITFEKEKTAYFNKLNPSGLLVRLYENLEDIQDLVKKESVEIIKLLINDEEGGGKRYIERSRIKSLLTKAKPTERGWRRDFGLVEENNWKRWWANVSKKLKKDPQFDTSSKLVIALRENPVSEIQNVYERFLAETELDKKLSICEHLIKLLDKNTDSTILNEIKEFTINLIKDNTKVSFLPQVIYNAIQLKLHGVDIELFNNNAYHLTYTALLNRKLPSSKAIYVFSFFKKLSTQNPFDHLILFLGGDRKLREVILTNFKRNKAAGKFLMEGWPGKKLSKQQALEINSSSTIGKDNFYNGLVDLTKLKEHKLITDFLSCILLSEDVHPSTKKVVANVVVAFNIKNVIYDYLANVQASEGTRLPLLQEFLNALGSQDAELCLNGMLLTEKAVRERPKVFLEALKNLVDDSISCIEARQKKRLIDSVVNLPQTLFDDNIDLKLEVSQIFANFDTPKRIGDFDDTDLIRIAESREIEIYKRFEAVKLLIKKGLKNDCQRIAHHLISGISENEFSILEAIFKAFSEHIHAKEFFATIIEEVNIEDESLRRAFISFLQNTNLTERFLDFILLEKDIGLHSKQFEKMTHLLKHEKFTKAITRFILQIMLSDSGKSENVIKRLTPFYPPFVNWILEEAKEFCITINGWLNGEIVKIKSEYTEEIKEILEKRKIEIEDAINKTSQRYEEYLKRLLFVVYDFEDIIKMIQEEEHKGFNELSRREMVSRLSSVKEGIEGVLRRAKVIDRE